MSRTFLKTICTSAAAAVLAVGLAPTASAKFGFGKPNATEIGRASCRERV